MSAQNWGFSRTIIVQKNRTAFKSYVHLVTFQSYYDSLETRQAKLCLISSKMFQSYYNSVEIPSTNTYQNQLNPFQSYYNSVESNERCRDRHDNPEFKSYYGSVERNWQRRRLRYLIRFLNQTIVVQKVRCEGQVSACR